MRRVPGYQATTGKIHNTRTAAVTDEVMALLNPIGHGARASVDGQTAEFIVKERKALIMILEQLDIPEEEKG